jgi:nitroreductase
MSHATTTVDRPSGEALTGAAAAAGYAPSILNTQPWRWRLEPGRLELFAERARQLTVTDPQGRLLTISCGAALHHARTALAAAGWSAHVARLPDAGQPDLLATLTVTGPTAAAELATRSRPGNPRPAQRPAAGQRPAAARRLHRHHRRRPNREQAAHLHTGSGTGAGIGRTLGRGGANRRPPRRSRSRVRSVRGPASPPDWSACWRPPPRACSRRRFGEEHRAVAGARHDHAAAVRHPDRVRVCQLRRALADRRARRGVPPG